MTNLTFRRLTANDAPAYQALRLESLAHNPSNFLSTLETEQKRSLESFERDLESASFGLFCGYYGVFQAEQLMGYLQIDGSFLPKQKHVAFLYNLYITFKARRLGLAKKLCQTVFELLRAKTDVELIFLSYNAQNQAGRDFYHSLGFKRCGVKTKAIKWENQYDDEVEVVLSLK